MQDTTQNAEEQDSTLTDNIISGPLKILCLHGFRQTATNFHGRTFALRRRLRHLAQFVFVDGPHELPPLIKPYQDSRHVNTEEHQDTNQRAAITDDLGSAGEHQPWQQEQEQEEMTAAMQQQTRSRRAWLVTPEQYKILYPDNHTTCTSNSPSIIVLSMEDDQHMHQTAGWEESWSYLQQVFQEQGPFDGVLGFSQGASVAATLCALLHQQQIKQQQEEDETSSPSPWFRFAILCSGYMSPEERHREVMAESREQGGLPVPSFHVFGSGGQDRQIESDESLALAECFQTTGRQIYMHDRGHYIPSDKTAVTQFKEFLGAMQALK